MRDNTLLSNNPKIGFIGCGNMASSLVRGLLSSKAMVSDDIIISDPDEKRRDEMRLLGVQTVNNNILVAEQSNFLIVGTKPNVILSALREIAQAPSTNIKRTAFVSIAAGISTQDIEKVIPGALGVIRVMPNIASTVQMSATTYACGSAFNPTNVSASSIKDLKVLVETIFSAAGTVCEIPESLMDASTGLAGSGPAFVFMLVEALADGGVRMGLSRDVAAILAAQTVKGAASMCLETNLHPGILKDRVCSPGGTTIAGVEALEKNMFRYAAISAVIASTERSKQLRDGKDK